MQFPNMDDEDGDFSFGATSRSRLSSLFQNENSSTDVNQALTFTAPKQPKKTDGAQGSSSALKLLHSNVVHAYKLKDDGTYSNQGKLGCAILGHHESSSYKLLLYKGKQIQVTFCSITPNFTFHIQPNNYVNFYDEKKENWSLNFDSEAVLTDFAKQVALAKINGQGKTSSSLVIQDFMSGEGPSLEQGDSTEVRYTGWLLMDHTFGQVFDSNLNSDSAFRLRLGKSKVIKGWSEGLIGAQKGTKRLLIVPPSLAYGSEGMGNAVPPNATLIFEIQIMKIKKSRESSHSPSPVRVSDSTADKRPDVPPRHSFSQDDNIRMRGASISEQLSQSPKKDKAHLISRMAKMGTATLPLQGAIPAQVSSESENEDEIHQESPSLAQSIGSRTSSPKATSKPRSRVNSGSSVVTPHVDSQPIQASVPFHMSPHSSQVSLYAHAAVPTPPLYTPATTFPTYQTQVASQFPVPQAQYPLHNLPGIMSPITSSVVDTHLPLLVTETRSQNAEVRLSLSKITDKVDMVIQKVDDLRLQGRAAGSGHMPFLESTVLVQNIERIVQENQRLKEDIDAKNSKIQSLNEKICDLFQRNQRFFEENSNMLEQRSDSLQAASALSHAKLLSLEQEKAKLMSELADYTAKLSSTEIDLKKQQEQNKELQQSLHEIEKKTKKQEMLLNNTQQQLNGDKTLSSSLQDELKNAKHENELLNTKYLNLEEKYNELIEAKLTLEKLYNESKLKVQEIKSKAEAEVMEIKAAHEIEISQFQERLKEKTLVSADTRNSNDAVSEADKLKIELKDVLTEKDEMQSKIQDLQKKLSAKEKSESSYKEKALELQNELESSLVWKKKYEVFHDKTRILKERYENQILELMAEVKQLQALKFMAASPDFSAEIKKVMNILYKLLQGKFDPSASYSGAKVLELTLQTIRGLTMQMLDIKRHSAAEEESEKGSESTSSENKLETPEKLSESNQTTREVGQSVPSPQLNGMDEGNIANDELSKKPTTSVSEAKPAVDASSLKIESETTQFTDDNLKKAEAEQVEEPSNLGDSVLKEGRTSKSENNVKPEDSKCASPDSNLHLSSNMFAGPLSENEGNKIWRPQPPPLFDDEDDDDDDDDDDWLK